MNEESYQRIRELEGELGLPEGFYEKLSGEDDWSFIIKIHSLIEAAVNYSLTAALGDPRLEGVIASLSMGGKTGKVAFMRALGLAETIHVRVIDGLSSLRNTFVHKIANVQMTLEEYIGSLDAGKLNDFVQVFGSVFPEDFISKYSVATGEPSTRQDFVKEQPQLNIWATVMYCLETFYLQKQNVDTRKELQRRKIEIAEAVASVLLAEKNGEKSDEPPST
jgi:hypothetical protein